MTSWIGRTLSDCQITKPMDRDAISDNYLGHHIRTRQPVRVQVFHANLSKSPDAIEAKKAQLQPLAALDHPNIARILAFDFSDGQPFLIAETFSGITLSSYLRDLSQQGLLLPLHTIAGLFGPICAAIDHAHAYGVIHRNLTPVNVMLRRVAAPPASSDSALTYIHPVVTNFSVAHILDPSPQPADALPAAKSPYLSPEQAHGRDINGLADIYSLGAVLYELLAGSPPFTDADSRISPEPRRKQNRELPPPPVNTPPAVMKVVQRAMDKNPNKRFQRAVDLADEFQTAIGLQPDPQPLAGDWTVASPRRKQKKKPSPRRHVRSLLMLLTIILSVIVLAILGILAYIAWQYLAGLGASPASSHSIAMIPIFLFTTTGIQNAWIANHRS